MGGYRKHASTRVRIALAVLVGALVATPMAVLASHRFSDVPTSHPFHREISAVADAGIARGFDDGTYKPSANVTRQAMAAFFQRGLSRVGFGEGAMTIGNATGHTTAGTVASASIDPGAAGSGTNGFVLVSGNITATTLSPGECPCDITVRLMADGYIQTAASLTIADRADEAGTAKASTGVEAVVPIAGDIPASFQLAVVLYDANAQEIGVAGQITALYVPFGPDGDDTLAYESTCQGGESEINDSWHSADTFGPDGCVAGRIVNPDSDYFAIFVGAGQTLTTETRSLDGAGCGGDTKLDVVDDDDFIMASDDDGGIGTCSRVVKSGLYPGEYYVRVRSYSPTDQFDYRVTAIVTSSSGSGVDADGDVDDISKE